MNKKNIFGGFVLILIALYLILSGIGVIQHLPLMQIIFTVLFVVWAIRGLVLLHSFEFFIPVGILGCMYDSQLGIEAITPWTWWLCIILIAIGFNIILGNVKKSRRKKAVFVSSTVEEYSNGSNVHIKNTFSQTSKYINSTDFVNADIENAFGQTNVYFDNAQMPSGVNGNINISNSFGQTDVYLPDTWHADIKKDAAFGSVNIHEHLNSNVVTNYVTINADCSFGEINIYFE